MDTNNQIVVYQTADNQTQIEVHMENETVWLTQAQMAELFQKDRTVISRHIRNVFNEGELDESLVCAKFALPKKYIEAVSHLFSFLGFLPNFQGT